ncbi:FAD-dependent oxidoreductase, partial [Sphingomonas sp.]|uniref:FAD-dependent oxidoreductase n=1 Tax=Sphingomonas sp. TaxID=28214 RepID=UPI002EDA9F9D
PRGRVAVLGAGPAGMAAALGALKAGHEVVVYERDEGPGGLLRFGVPDFKLEKHYVDRRIAVLEAEGIRFEYGVDVGSSLSPEELLERHDALVLAIGSRVHRPLDVPGADLQGVRFAMDYLYARNRFVARGEDPADDPELTAAGKHVVVIGGGDTAMDCVRTAVRQGAASVKCLYRRDRANMPGSQRETANAEEEGVEFVWLSAPEAFDAKDNGGGDKVTAVKAVGMRLGAPDASGRRAPEPDPGSAFDVPADLVIKALGFDAEDLPNLFDAPELGVTRWGTIRTDARTMMSNLDGVFAAGDIVKGASLVVQAIRDGRDVSERMHAWLKAQAAAPARKQKEAA